VGVRSALAERGGKTCRRTENGNESHKARLSAQGRLL